MSATTTATAPAVDAGNTKCAVDPDGKVKPGVTAEYNGKIYHFCCADCLADFNKDPAKYAKAIASDPAKYGVKN